VALRNVRRDAAQQYKKLEKDGKSSKDSCEGYCKSLDEMTNDYVKKVDEIVKKKSEEIMKV
jgi:ribosome recycling factor